MNNNLLQTKGLPKFVQEQNWKKWQIFLCFASILVINVSSFLFKSRNGLSPKNAFGGTYIRISNPMILLLPVVLELSFMLNIPINLTFLVQPMFARRNLIPKMLPKAFASYFLSLGVSLFSWNLIRKESAKNRAKFSDDFWLLVLQISTGVLWYNLLSAFMPNFMMFLPGEPNDQNILLFLFLGLIVLFSSVRNIINCFEKQQNKDPTLDFRFSAIFNILYTTVMLILVTLDDTVPVASPWIFMGLGSGMEIIFNEPSGGPKISLFFKKITDNILRISIGTLIPLIFINIIKI
jgi:uncharacterized membrane protein HdeD (DUF308 family)